MIGPNFDPPIFDGVVGIDHENEVLRLIGAHRLIREKQRLIFAAARDTDPRKEPGAQHQGRIGENGSPKRGARVGIEPVIDEIEKAVMWKSRFIPQPQFIGILPSREQGTSQYATGGRT